MICFSGKLPEYIKTTTANLLLIDTLIVLAFSLIGSTAVENYKLQNLLIYQRSLTPSLSATLLGVLALSLYHTSSRSFARREPKQVP